MMSIPTVTVFGSCRVHTPCSILEKLGNVKMNQKNIFGFAHYTSEILQQFNLITGARQAPSRLRPYLNIPEYWKDPPANTIESLKELFQDTDIFVVEISSIRQIKFKSMFLQINRTRELLATNDDLVKRWWEPLVRSGTINRNIFANHNMSPTQIEVASLMEASEQSSLDVYKDILKLSKLLGKKVILVSHFNVNYQGQAIPQRSVIVDALARIGYSETMKVFDPTLEVLRAGISNSIQDLGHYQPNFEGHIAECIFAKISEFGDTHVN